VTLRKTITAALLLAALSVAGVADAQRRGGPPGRGGSPFGNFPLKIEQLRDGIYLIQSSSSGNITVFTSDDGLLLVDTKLTNEYDGAMELLRSVTDKPIRFVINTHMHPDHTGGNAFIEALGSNIVATENARKRLAETQMSGLPNITFDDHMRLFFGGRVMDFYWLGRGHTDGDLVIHLPEDGLILTGDLFAGGDPFVRAVDHNGGGNLTEWSSTLKKVLELDFDAVIPGHSELTDRAKLQAYLDDTVRIQDLIREMHAAGRAPEDIEQAISNEFGGSALVAFSGFNLVLAEFE
jgi:cyclase